ncbi:hypothetical protein [Jannaschia faecimaris]|uniref:hypothetical protein n=1 Tax=Jannaschia faecimaris TaxID=1244108 RepID=UPI00147B68CE|nr:hypothetical protein [Jannaschia faecimaris]
MKTTFKAFRQHIMPDTTRTIGSVRAHKALPHHSGTHTFSFTNLDEGGFLGAREAKKDMIVSHQNHEKSLFGRDLRWHGEKNSKTCRKW